VAAPAGGAIFGVDPSSELILQLRKEFHFGFSSWFLRCPTKNGKAWIQNTYPFFLRQKKIK